MAKANKTNGTTTKPTETATKLVPTAKSDDDAIVASMFDVTIEGVGGGNKWRLTLTANDSHPTESGVQFMTTVRGELDAAVAAVEQALADLTADE